MMHPKSFALTMSLIMVGLLGSVPNIILLYIGGFLWLQVICLIVQICCGGLGIFRAVHHSFA